MADTEAVLALHTEPYDAARPVVCFAERPCVLRADVRELLPARPGTERKPDHVYARGGTFCALVPFEPL